MSLWPSRTGLTGCDLPPQGPEMTSWECIARPAMRLCGWEPQTHLKSQSRSVHWWASAARYTKAREYSGLARNVSNNREGSGKYEKNRKRELKRQPFPQFSKYVSSALWKDESIRTWVQEWRLRGVPLLPGKTVQAVLVQEGAVKPQQHQLTVFLESPLKENKNQGPRWQEGAHQLPQWRKSG